MSPGKILNMIAFTPEISHWLNYKHKLAMFHIFNPITVHLKIMLTVAKIFFDINLLGKERQKKRSVLYGRVARLDLLHSIRSCFQLSSFKLKHFERGGMQILDGNLFSFEISVHFQTVK